MPNFTQRAFAHGKQDDVSHVWNSNTVPIHSPDADGTADVNFNACYMLHGYRRRCMSG